MLERNRRDGLDGTPDFRGGLAPAQIVGSAEKERVVEVGNGAVGDGI